MAVEIAVVVAAETVVVVENLMLGRTVDLILNYLSTVLIAKTSPGFVSAALNYFAVEQVAVVELVVRCSRFHSPLTALGRERDSAFCSKG